MIFIIIRFDNPGVPACSEGLVFCQSKQACAPAYAQHPATYPDTCLGIVTFMVWDGDAGGHASTTKRRARPSRHGASQHRPAQ